MHTQWTHSEVKYFVPKSMDIENSLLQKCPSYGHKKFRNPAFAPARLH